MKLFSFVLIFKRRHSGKLCIFLCVTTLFGSTSCDEFLKIGPSQNQLSTSLVFADNSTANAAMDGIYYSMVNGSYFLSGSIFSLTFLTGLSSDEFDDYSKSEDRVEFYTNLLSVTNGSVKGNWQSAYQLIYYANSVLNGLAGAENISPDTKSQLEGESKFVRAFCYFYLVNLFGEIPLITTTDYKMNRLAERVNVEQVYDLIVADLEAAKKVLPEGFDHLAGERIRPNKWAAVSLLARIHLFRGDWISAEREATIVIENKSLFQLSNDLNTVFLKESKEAIWQLKSVSPGINTSQGQNFIPRAAPTSVALNQSTLTAFEIGDKRKANWIGSTTVLSNVYYYPYKYKVRTSTTITEYAVVLRLAEQYLIRAEARAQQTKYKESLEDLNIIRVRAALPPLSLVNNSEMLLNAILQERRVELFSEWGHRWLDLKRTGKADSILKKEKSTWLPNAKLYPIPQSERDNNQRLSQNPGY